MITELSLPVEPDINGGWISTVMSQSGSIHNHRDCDTEAGIPNNQTFCCYIRRFSNDYGASDDRKLYTWRDMRLPWSSGSQGRMVFEGELGVLYNIVLKRQNDLMTIEVYKVGNLVSTDSLSLLEGAQTYDYFYPVMGYGGIRDFVVSGTFSNFQFIPKPVTV